MDLRDVTEYNKPPVVEVSIAVDFDPNEEKREWNLELVKQFSRNHEQEFPHREPSYENQLEVQLTSPTELPKVVSQNSLLKYVRLFDQNRSRVIQLGDDQLSFYIVRNNSAYPRYARVREEAARFLREYMDLFQPARIRHAAIHYIDIIDIPIPESGKIDIATYFNHIADLPEDPFGLVLNIEMRYLIECPIDVGPLYYQLKRLAAPAAEKVIRFRADWKKQCRDIASIDLETLFSRLDTAHDYMRKSFENVLTDETRQLFDPIEKD